MVNQLSRCTALISVADTERTFHFYLYLLDPWLAVHYIVNPNINASHHNVIRL